LWLTLLMKMGLRKPPTLIYLIKMKLYALLFPHKFEQNTYIVWHLEWKCCL
jgi:hypothetical protein